MTKTFIQILLTSFLVLGFNPLNISHAETDVNSLDIESHECPISGFINLQLEGTIQKGRLAGFIDIQYVSWNVMSGFVDDFYNGNFLRLKLAPIKNNELTLSGWIGSYYVNWRTFGGNFNEFVQCR